MISGSEVQPHLNKLIASFALKCLACICTLITLIGFGYSGIKTVNAPVAYCTQYMSHKRSTSLKQLYSTMFGMSIVACILSTANFVKFLMFFLGSKKKSSESEQPGQELALNSPQNQARQSLNQTYQQTQLSENWLLLHVGFNFGECLSTTVIMATSMSFLVEGMVCVKLLIFGYLILAALCILFGIAFVLNTIFLMRVLEKLREKLGAINDSDYSASLSPNDLAVQQSLQNDQNRIPLANMNYGSRNQIGQNIINLQNVSTNAGNMLDGMESPNQLSQGGLNAEVLPKNTANSKNNSTLHNVNNQNEIKRSDSFVKKRKAFPSYQKQLSKKNQLNSKVYNLKFTINKLKVEKPKPFTYSPSQKQLAKDPTLKKNITKKNQQLVQLKLLNVNNNQTILQANSQFQDQQSHNPPDKISINVSGVNMLVEASQFNQQNSEKNKLQNKNKLQQMEGNIAPKSDKNKQPLKVKNVYKSRKHKKLKPINMSIDQLNEIESDWFKVQSSDSSYKYDKITPKRPKRNLFSKQSKEIQAPLTPIPIDNESKSVQENPFFNLEQSQSYHQKSQQEQFQHNSYQGKRDDEQSKANWVKKLFNTKPTFHIKKKSKAIEHIPRMTLFGEDLDKTFLANQAAQNINKEEQYQQSEYDEQENYGNQTERNFQNGQNIFDANQQQRNNEKQPQPEVVEYENELSAEEKMIRRLKNKW